MAIERDLRPAAIVRAADADDVRRVVTLARETETELAVRSGGHSVAGHSTSDGGLVLDLRELSTLELDVDARQAWTGAGMTAGEYTVAAAAEGLATGFGDTGSVGIGGITTGGGVGFLARKHGPTIDHLLAAEVVTADGELLHVDETSHPDLFWAIRGGGGNFGVVTRFRFRLHPVDPFVGGMLFPDRVRVHGVDRRCRDRRGGARPVPRARDTDRRHGAADDVPGDVHAGRGGLPPDRRVPQRLHGRGDTDHAEAIVERLLEPAGQMQVVQLRALGGAIARVPNDATAYAHRNRRFMVNVASIYVGDEGRPTSQSWVDGMVEALLGDDLDAYCNFVGDEGPERARACYPGGTWDRLREIKRRYDPEDVFRLNQNVPPA